MARHVAFGEAVNDAERWAFKLLSDELPRDYILLTNIEIPTPSGQALEVDALVVGKWGVYVVDVKGYIGRLDAGMHAWSLDGRHVDNSLAKANYVARVLAGKLKHKIPVGVYAPWCQGMVFVTGRKGDEIELDKPQKNFGVYTPQQIVHALTHEWAVTAPHKFALTEQQKEYVLDTIGQVSVVEQQNNRIQDFEKQQCLYIRQGLEIWQANYAPGDWSSPWLLKVLTPSAFDSQTEFNQHKVLIEKELYTLQQLAGCSGVPYCAPLIHTGEQVVLPIKMPKGVPIEAFDWQAQSESLLFDLLRRATTSLQQIHRRGFTVSNWGEQSVFLSNEGDVEYINIANTVEAVEDVRHFAVCFEKIVEHLYDPRIRVWFLQAKKGRTVNLDLLRAILSTAIVSNVKTDLALKNKPSNASPCEIKPGTIIDSFYQLDIQLAETECCQIWQVKHTLGLYKCSMNIYSAVHKAWPHLDSIYSSLTSLYHPNIERILQFGKLPLDDSLYVCTEWVDGEPLAEWRDKIVIGEGVAAAWFKQMLTALQYMHKFDIHHGAICPRNIIVNQNKAVLVNFGAGLDIAASQYSRQYADPDLWALEGGAERDLYGLVASFVDVLSPQGLQKNLSHQALLQTLDEFDQTIFPVELFDICKKILTFDVMIDSNTDYLALFKFIDDVVLEPQNEANAG